MVTWYEPPRATNLVWTDEGMAIVIPGYVGHGVTRAWALLYLDPW